jgi:PhzF family phenazine biosynthesis protein
MTETTVVHVDAFSARPFAGNPAGVCVLPAPRPEAWMQAVAQELNLSETAFLVPREDGFHLRWFTPVSEVDLCGHATLASAHVLWEDGHLAATEEARFHTLSGILTARRDGVWIELDFPAEVVSEAQPPAGLVEALGVTPEWIGHNRLDWLIAVADEQAVRDVAPDFGALKRVETRGVMVTARASSPVTPATGAPIDFVSRYFAPAFGIDEDPVTGSAHCALAPFWAARLGRDQLTGVQVSPRGGLVRVHHRGDRVELGGQAVTVLRSVLTAAAAMPPETTVRHG